MRLLNYVLSWGFTSWYLISWSYYICSYKLVCLRPICVLYPCYSHLYLCVYSFLWDYSLIKSWPPTAKVLIKMIPVVSLLFHTKWLVAMDNYSTLFFMHPVFMSSRLCIIFRTLSTFAAQLLIWAIYVFAIYVYI